MLPPGQMRQTIQEIGAYVHAQKWQEATQAYHDLAGVNIKAKSEPKHCQTVLLGLLHWLLNNNGFEEAATLLWTEKLFNPNPKCVRQLWNFFDEAMLGLIMGAGSMGKSFNLGVRLFLEWVRDPKGTTVRVVGPSESHLQQNLFSHLVSLHQGASLPMPGEIGDLFIGCNRRDQRFSVSGIIIPVGQNKKAGRLQGVKRYPRAEPHPIFGDQSRLFVFLDEAENVPAGIFSDIDNLLSNVSDDDNDGLKIFGAFNPSNRDGAVGKRCEPPFGWDALDPDKHFRWKSTRDWEVLRLDAMQSENVLAGKTIYRGLQTRAAVERIIRNAGGNNSPGYWTFVRAMFPPSGVEMSIIPSGMLKGKRGEFLWLDDPTPVGSCDLALEGGAAAVFCKGRWGLATGIKLLPTPEHPTGVIKMFEDAQGRIIPRFGLQLDQLFELEKGDTVSMKTQIMKLCRAMGIKPGWVMLDRTGNGSGTHDLLKSEWSPEVRAVNYSEGATEKKVLSEDTLTPKQEFDRIASELWFALKKFLEFEYLMIAPSVDNQNMIPQLTTRLFRPSGAHSRVESKADYIKRGHTSPNEADALTLLVHAARMASGITLSMKGGAEGAGMSEGGGGPDWHRVDASNRNDTLDGAERGDITEKDFSFENW